jgi:hypothetical protein
MWDIVGHGIDVSDCLIGCYGSEMSIDACEAKRGARRGGGAEARRRGGGRLARRESGHGGPLSGWALSEGRIRPPGGLPKRGLAASVKTLGPRVC